LPLELAEQVVEVAVGEIERAQALLWRQAVRSIRSSDYESAALTSSRAGDFGEDLLRRHRTAAH
jgi:hypothetical protein